jgi:hypothetical protein
MRNMWWLAVLAVWGAMLGGATANAAGPWPGKPASSPPKLGSATTGPPPAWVESRVRSWWLAYSSYCWKTTCADFIPPQSRTDLPVLSVRRGAALRLHLGFVPRRVSVAIGLGTNAFERQLKATRVNVFVPRRPGLLVVSAQAAGGGDASYVARVRLR